MAIIPAIEFQEFSAWVQQYFQFLETQYNFQVREHRFTDGPLGDVTVIYFSPATIIRFDLHQIEMTITCEPAGHSDLALSFNTILDFLIRNQQIKPVKPLPMIGNPRAQIIYNLFCYARIFQRELGGILSGDFSLWARIQQQDSDRGLKSTLAGLNQG